MGSLGTQQQPETITAENVHSLFPEVNTHLAQSHKVPTSDSDLQGYDPEQIRLMEEVCIVLDNDDMPIGSASKKVCTLNQKLYFLFKTFTRTRALYKCDLKLLETDSWIEIV